MVEVAAIIANSAGIHCRPSAAIVKALSGYPGEITVLSDNGSCNPRSIMGLLSLCLQEGTPIRIQVEGPDEDSTARQVASLFETHYDFPARLNGEDTQALLSHSDLPAQPPASPH